MSIDGQNNTVDNGKQKKWSKVGLLAIMIYPILLIMAGWTPSIMMTLLIEFNILVVFFFIECIALYWVGKAIEHYGHIPKSTAGWSSVIVFMVLLYIFGGSFLIFFIPISAPGIIISYWIGKGIEKFIQSRKK